ncbi:MAG: transcriptional regulator GcvA [Acetobacterales bacterium]
MHTAMPPLTALRAFEAAARHLSLTRAAAELSVTTAAVSHQIKSLEEFLGIALMIRNGRGIGLTEAGQQCLPALSEGFIRLGEAVNSVRTRADSGPLTIRASASFASKWLVPRLDRFTHSHPDVDVRLSASPTPVDFSREDVDLAVIYGLPDQPGVKADLLFPNEVFPVCSPKLLEGSRPLREPADLRNHVLLHHDSPIRDVNNPDWAMWLRAAGVTDVNARRGPHFDQVYLVIDEAISGYGVGLVGSALVADDLRAGRLVRPFELSMPVPFAYYVLTPEYKARMAKVAAFRDWLIREAAGSRIPAAAEAAANA